MALRVGYKQIEAARKVNLIDFLKVNYPEYIAFNPKTKEYIHPDHDSLKIFESGFFRFSNGKGGDSIRYLQEFIGLSFPESVLKLIEFDGFAGTSDVQINEVKRKPKQKEPKKKKPMPERANRNTELITYLVNERGIDRETVDLLLQEDLIYQDTKNNIVFLNNDADFALLRGTGTSFKQVWQSGHGYWGFEIGDDSQEVYITESPIDAISLYLLRNKTPGIYLAMGGLKINTFIRIVGEFTSHKIKIAPDWDDAGKAFVKECFETLSTVVYLHPKKERLENAGECKDWNELLLAEKNQREFQNKAKRQ